MPPDEPQPPAVEESQPSSAGESHPDPAAEPMPAAPPKEAIDSGAAAATSGVGAPAPRRLVYLPAFRYVFDNPEWFATIVFATIFSFLPVLGQVALWGYSYEIIEALYRRPDSPYPKFDFRRLGEYCMRGVWPYVLAATVGAILTFILQPVYQGALQGGMMLWMSNQQMAGVVTAIVAPILIIGLLILSVGVAVGMAPFLLRAGLTQDIRLIFRSAWINGYWKRVWVEQVLAFLFLLASTAVFRLVGCCVFGVGFFAAYTVIWIAGSHLQWQIYEIYLERGGEPIPLHPLPAEAPPVQMAMPEPEGSPFAVAEERQPGQ